MARWLELLQEFDFEVIHRSGRCHTNADALSRYKDEGEGNSSCVTATLLAAKDSGCVTQKLIRVKSDPAGSLLVAIIDPAGSLLAAKSDPPLQKVIRVQILVDSSLF